MCFQQNAPVHESITKCGKDKSTKKGQRRLTIDDTSQKGYTSTCSPIHTFDATEAGCFCTYGGGFEHFDLHFYLKPPLKKDLEWGLWFLNTKHTKNTDWKSSSSFQYKL